MLGVGPTFTQQQSPTNAVSNLGACGTRNSYFLPFVAKKASAREMIEPGTSVAARNENTLTRLAGRLIPKYGDTVGGVFAGDAAEAGEPSGANLIQPDKADAGNSETAMQFGPKGRRQKATHNLCIYPEVD